LKGRFPASGLPQEASERIPQKAFSAQGGWDSGRLPLLQGCPYFLHNGVSGRRPLSPVAARRSGGLDLENRNTPSRTRILTAGRGTGTDFRFTDDLLHSSAATPSRMPGGLEV